ncbi:MAG: hypothetical protein A3A51_00195 [Candidatus Levybacteria bacterium RIFCSPLOWO2_01_FULL_39_10]|nr:MAG: hypothetical protein A3A51_00195 [Candidatus Levybacteria bacterium RIFCSPLOWO2_01_FULL_39_10]
MNINYISSVVEIFTQLTTAIAIILGGIWGYWNFVIRRTGIWNLQMSILPQVHSYHGKDRLLIVVNITLKNVGNVKIVPGPSGCRLTVIKLPKNIKEYNVLDWKKGQVLFKNIDILRNCKVNNSYEGGYELEPNNEYHEFETFIVKKGDLLAIRCKFYCENNKDVIHESTIFQVNT